VSKKASRPRAADRPRPGQSSGRWTLRLWLPLVALAVLGVVTALWLKGGSDESSWSRPQTGGILAADAAAPAVRLPATNGSIVDLAGFRNKRNVLLYFYEHAG